jgi:hypothetical protein
MHTIKITTAVTMLVIASPAFAYSSHHAVSASQRPAAVASDIVIVGGRYIGQDPDPLVRAELYRDYDDYLGDD